MRNLKLNQASWFGVWGVGAVSVNTKTFWSVKLFTSLYFRQCLGVTTCCLHLQDRFTNLSSYFYRQQTLKWDFTDKLGSKPTKKYKLIRLNMSMIQELFYMYILRSQFTIWLTLSTLMIQMLGVEHVKSFRSPLNLCERSSRVWQRHKQMFMAPPFSVTPLLALAATQPSSMLRF